MSFLRREPGARRPMSRRFANREIPQNCREDCYNLIIHLGDDTPGGSETVLCHDLEKCRLCMREDSNNSFNNNFGDFWTTCQGPLTPPSTSSIAPSTTTMIVPEDINTEMAGTMEATADVVPTGAPADPSGITGEIGNQNIESYTDSNTDNNLAPRIGAPVAIIALILIAAAAWFLRSKRKKAKLAAAEAEKPPYIYASSLSSSSSTPNITLNLPPQLNSHANTNSTPTGTPFTTATATALPTRPLPARTPSHRWVPDGLSSRVPGHTPSPGLDFAHPYDPPPAYSENPPVSMAVPAPLPSGLGLGHERDRREQEREREVVTLTQPRGDRTLADGNDAWQSQDAQIRRLYDITSIDGTGPGREWGADVKEDL